MKSCLVTGGFGFIGSHVVDALLAQGDEVHVVDDMSSSIVGVKDFATGREGLTYSIMTVADYATGRTFPSRSRDRFDEIYHLASPVGPVGILRRAGRIAGDIICDVEHVVSIALRDCARVCNVSTSEVYGGGRHGACAESDPRIFQPEATVRLEYAAGKLAGEIALLNRARVTAEELRITIVRPFNVAGPRQSWRGGFVIPRFIRQALVGDPITVYGDGSAVRAFTHVSEMADGIIAATRKGRRGGVYNLGRAANKTTILDLAKLVLQVTGSPSKITHVDPLSLHGGLFAEAGDKFPDGDLSARELSWIPEHDLERIVRDALDYSRGTPGG